MSGKPGDSLLTDSKPITSPTERMIAFQRGGVGWMIFNNPAKHNALSVEMWKGMGVIMSAFQKEPSIRVVVMKGAGENAFISGADISEFAEHRSSASAEEEYNRISAESQLTLKTFNKPLIAMINGYCIGGGLGVALAADIRICSDNSVFSIPAARLGLGYGFDGMKTLSDLVGPSSAKDIMFTARKLKAKEAANMGLVNIVTKQNELEDAVEKYVSKVSENAPLTIAAAKLAVNETLKDPEKRDLHHLEQKIRSIFDSEDYKEGRTAFMEKRRPVFRGR